MRQLLAETGNLPSPLQFLFSGVDRVAVSRCFPRLQSGQGISLCAFERRPQIRGRASRLGYDQKLALEGACRRTAASANGASFC